MPHPNCGLEDCVFFSSRRRHTRFDCDWSSDVCSSDLYSPRTLLTMNVGLSDTRYPKDSTRLAFHEQVLERLSRLPGVESAAFVTHVPYSERSEERRVGKECRSRWSPYH